MINHFINQFLGTIGLRVTKSSTYERMHALETRFLYNTPSTSDIFLLAAVARHKPLRFLQIGANDGVSHDVLFDYVTTFGAVGVVVEPLAEPFLSLSSVYEPFPDITPVRKAIHKTADSVTMYQVSPQGLASMPEWASGLGSFNREHLLRYGVPEESIQCEQVPCIDLMGLISEHQLNNINYLQIDTEGYDAEIISMIDFSVISPALIKFEHINLSDEEKEFTINKLKSFGYQIFWDIGDVVAWRH